MAGLSNATDMLVQEPSLTKGLAIGGEGPLQPSPAAAVAAAATSSGGAAAERCKRTSKGGMAPLTSIWSDIVGRRRSGKGKLVRYDHPSPREVRAVLPVPGRWLARLDWNYFIVPL